MLMAQISEKVAEADGLGEFRRCEARLDTREAGTGRAQVLGQRQQDRQIPASRSPAAARVEERKRLGARLRKGVDGWLAAARWP